MNKSPWMLTREQLIMKLTVLNAYSGMSGRPCPVAALVLSRLTGV